MSCGSAASAICDRRMGVSAYLGIFIKVLPWIFCMAAAIICIWFVVFVPSVKRKSKLK